MAHINEGLTPCTAYHQNELNYKLIYFILQDSPSSPTSSLTSRNKKLSSSVRPNLQTVIDTRVAVVWCESLDVIGRSSSRIHTSNSSKGFQSDSKFGRKKVVSLQSEL